MEDKKYLTVTDPGPFYDEKIGKNNSRIKALLAEINKLKEENRRFRKKQKFLLIHINR